MARPARKRFWRFGCLILAVIVLAGAGAGWWFFMRPKPKPEKTYTVKKGAIAVSVRESGFLEPYGKVEIKSKASGRILKLTLEAGDRVTSGQLIAQVDSVETESSVNMVRNQVRAAESRARVGGISANLQRVESPVTQEQAELALKQSQLRVQQLRRDLETQPALTAASLAQAESAATNARTQLETLTEVTHPQARIEAEGAVRDAQTARTEAANQAARAASLYQKGFYAQRDVDASQTALSAAENRLKQAQQRLSTLTTQQTAERRTAETRLREAEATLAQAKALAERDALKRLELDRELAVLRDAELRVKLARNGMAQIPIRQEQALQSQADAAASRSQLKEAMNRLSETTIRAPMDGVITQRYIESGELVTSATAGVTGGTPLVQIADLSRMKIRLQLNEVDTARILPGLPVEVRLDAVQNALFRGVIRKVAPASLPVDQTGGVVKFLIEVVIDNPDKRMKPGMSAKCRILVDERKNTLVLPLEAVTLKGAGKGEVLLVTRPAQGKTPAQVTKKTVKTGLRNDTEVEILSGLSAGQTVQRPKYTGPAMRQFEFGPN